TLASDSKLAVGPSVWKGKRSALHSLVEVSVRRRFVSAALDRVFPARAFPPSIHARSAVLYRPSCHCCWVVWSAGQFGKSGGCSVWDLRAGVWGHRALGGWNFLLHGLPVQPVSRAGAAPRAAPACLAASVALKMVRSKPAVGFLLGIRGLQLVGQADVDGLAD